MNEPFDTTGIQTGDDGIRRYEGLAQNLVHVLQATTAAHGERTAIVELGSADGRVSYGDLWQRAARVAGGLVATGLERGDRVAVRLPNGADWVVSFWGCLLYTSPSPRDRTRSRMPSSA